jgi:hypothetical protein
MQQHTAIKPLISSPPHPHAHNRRTLTSFSSTIRWLPPPFLSFPSCHHQRRSTPSSLFHSHGCSHHIPFLSFFYFFMRAPADGHHLNFSPSSISHGRPLHISYLHLLLLHQNRVPMTPWIGFCCSSNLGTHGHRRFSMVSCRKSPDAHPTWHLCSSCLPLDLLCMPQIVPRESCRCFIGTLFLWQCHHHQLLLALTKRQGRPFLFFL